VALHSTQAKIYIFILGTNTLGDSKYSRKRMFCLGFPATDMPRCFHTRPEVMTRNGVR